jgi:hypothetical protein
LRAERRAGRSGRGPECAVEVGLRCAGPRGLRGEAAGWLERREEKEAGWAAGLCWAAGLV